jgi:nicotinate-nucleotide adenylyltransferase
MLALATQDEPSQYISTVELDSPERPFTVDTLARLQNVLGESVRVFFVMGADSWLEITTWHEWKRLFDLADLLVVSRPGFQLTGDLVSETRGQIIDLRGMDRESAQREVEKREIEETGPKAIYLTDAVEIDISATAIRAAVRSGAPGHCHWAALVPPPVADYIRKYKLYQANA